MYYDIYENNINDIDDNNNDDDEYDVRIKVDIFGIRSEILTILCYNMIY